MFGDHDNTSPDGTEACFESTWRKTLEIETEPSSSRVWCVGTEEFGILLRP